MHKVVLDTNVIISGLIFPKSKPARLLDLVARGELANFNFFFHFKRDNQKPYP